MIMTLFGALSAGTKTYLLYQLYYTYAQTNVESRPYSKSISTTKHGIVPILQIHMHHLLELEPGAFSM